MERKRKLPARAAARVDAVSKKRTSTPPAELPPPPPPAVEEPLPTSIVAGKPLPTIEKLQADDLPVAEYQSISERYVPSALMLRRTG